MRMNVPRVLPGTPIAYRLVGIMPAPFAEAVDKPYAGAPPRIIAWKTTMDEDDLPPPPRQRSGGFGAALIRLNVERDLVAFVQAAHAGRFDGADVHEHILAAAFRRDEAEALGGVEELDSTDSHFIFLG